MPYKRKSTKYKRKAKRRTRKRAALKGGNNPIVFYNKYHYGDHILNLKFLFNISNKIKEKGVKVKYIYDSNYIKNIDELQRYVNPETVELEALTSTLPESAIDLWMGKAIEGKAAACSENCIFDKYFTEFYTMILSKLGIDPAGIDVSLYQDEPYLQDIYNKLDPKFKDLDILIINAAPHSGQFNYDKKKMDAMCSHLAKKFKIAVTTPLDEDKSVVCTMTENLKLQDIGAISTHTKYIVGVHSGPLMACYTAATKANVKKWIIFNDWGINHSEINNVILTHNYDHGIVEQHIK